MRQHTTPTLREMDLQHGISTRRFRAPAEFWDDPDLAPAPRREVPLSAFA